MSSSPIRVLLVEDSAADALLLKHELAEASGESFQVVRIVAVGNAVKQHQVGERCLVQTDYRDLRTPASNAAFG